MIFLILLKIHLFHSHFISLAFPNWIANEKYCARICSTKFDWLIKNEMYVWLDIRMSQLQQFITILSFKTWNLMDANNKITFFSKCTFRSGIKYLQSSCLLYNVSKHVDFWYKIYITTTFSGNYKSLQWHTLSYYFM